MSRQLRFTEAIGMKIGIKRVYEKPDRDDGLRILVDRLWPRGLTKAAAKIDFWPKELAPSNELRRWYGHDPGKWAEFKSRYFRELDANPGLVKEIRGRMREGKVTFVYGSREEAINNAVALKEYLSAKKR
ncbi:MAG TPA: DUF488 domain-containing protein [Syntrophales bacterium]|nr:DUF488 domain-containing protein [Syntrophales bacterium]HQM30061.1 DUF488 domain-containing protein [Syntrophales bacterium]